MQGFFRFLGWYGGLTFIVFLAVTFLVSGYQNFVKDTKMLEKLYAEEKEATTKDIERFER